MSTTRTAKTIYFKFFNEHITSQIIYQIVEGLFIASQSVVIVKAINLNLVQIELIASENRALVYIFR